MSRVPVWASGPAFVAAISHLPDRVHRAARPDGAICVVDASREMLDDARSLVAARPAALVLSHPGAADEPFIDLLAAAGVPVVVDRPLLRADVAEQASGLGLRHVIVEVVSRSTELREAVIEGVGWARTALGHPLRVVATTRTADARLGALEGSGGTTATVGATTQSTALPPALEVHGLGERRLEVEIDAVTGIRSRAHDADGFFEQAPRYESRERLALRRALEATSSVDLSELVHDRAVADELLGATDR